MSLDYAVTYVPGRFIRWPAGRLVPHCRRSVS